MPAELIFGLCVVASVMLGLASVVALRWSGARPGTARRLAGPAEVKVGHLLDAGSLSPRAVRVSGRIRCRDPLHGDGGERLVAFHRDVDVRIRGRWHRIERLRETRSFELWDHDGSLTVDPAHAAEPLIAIPKVWRGPAAALEEPHASAVARLVEREGAATEARAITRSVNVADRVLLLARAVRQGERVRLEPPGGGYLITNLELPDAMRLLGGRHRRLVAGAVIGLALATALAAIGIVGALASLALR